MAPKPHKRLNPKAQSHEGKKQRPGRKKSISAKKTVVLLALAGALCVAALVGGVHLTMAAFSANDYLKAVAATNEAANLLSSDLLATFSSDPSSEGSNRIPNKSVVVNPEDPSFTFSIFNYLQNDPTIWCQKDITYDLRITAEGSSNPASCKINGTPLSNGSATVSGQKLKARQKSDLTYTVALPSADVNKVVFKVFVTVTDAGGTTVRYLAANIAPSQAADIKSNEVTVTSVDRSGSNKPSDFDGYNYDITVSGSSIDVTLTWNPDLVQLDPNFVPNYQANHQGYGASASGNTLTFHMDPGTQRVNLYRLAGKVTDSTSWPDLEVKVSTSS